MFRGHWRSLWMGKPLEASEYGETPIYLRKFLTENILKLGEYHFGYLGQMPRTFILLLFFTSLTAADREGILG